MEVGSSFRIAVMVSADVGLWNVCFPVTSSYTMVPNEKMSERWSTSSANLLGRHVPDCPHHRTGLRSAATVGSEPEASFASVILASPEI